MRAQVVLPERYIAPMCPRTQGVKHRGRGAEHVNGSLEESTSLATPRTTSLVCGIPDANSNEHGNQARKHVADAVAGWRDETGEVQVRSCGKKTLRTNCTCLGRMDVRVDEHPHNAQLQRTFCQLSRFQVIVKMAVSGSGGSEPHSGIQDVVSRGSAC